MVAQGRLCWISVLSSFRLTFTFLFSVMCQIYIARKIKIQGVPWCEKQSWYHISCHTSTAQVMFVFELFERATFICKQNSTHSPALSHFISSSFLMPWLPRDHQYCQIPSTGIWEGFVATLYVFLRCVYSRDEITFQHVSICFVRTPTTLPTVALINFSVSGKTAINNSHGQKFIGPFWCCVKYVAHQLSLLVQTPLHYPSPDWEFISLDSLLTKIFATIQPPLHKLVSSPNSIVDHPVLFLCTPRSQIKWYW